MASGVPGEVPCGAQGVQALLVGAVAVAACGCAETLGQTSPCSQDFRIRRITGHASSGAHRGSDREQGLDEGSFGRLLGPGDHAWQSLAPAARGDGGKLDTLRRTWRTLRAPGTSFNVGLLHGFGLQNILFEKRNMSRPVARKHHYKGQSRSEAGKLGCVARSLALGVGTLRPKHTQGHCLLRPAQGHNGQFNVLPRTCV